MAILLRALVPAALAISLFGQTQVSSGDIRGAVTDQNGGALVGAKVTVSEPHRNFSRTVTTDVSGDYRFRLLPPDIYRVRVEAAGFTTKIFENVEVRIGEAVNLRIALDVGTVTTEITIAADAAAIETERTQQATTIESGRIENLPINRRNYLDFALLAPGVVETNDMVDGTDFRVVQTPQSGLSFGGSNGRGNAFHHRRRGELHELRRRAALRQPGGRAGVPDQPQQLFAPNSAAPTGGAINIITKSGTNDVHGNLFGFLRHRDIQARNYFDPGKSAFTRGQYGATFSAPLIARPHFPVRCLRAPGPPRDRLRADPAGPLVFRPAHTLPAALATSSTTLPCRSCRPLGTRHAAGISSPITSHRTLALFNANSGNFPFGERLQPGVLAPGPPLQRGATASSCAAISQQAMNQNAQFGALIGFNRGRGIDTSDGTLMAGQHLRDQPALGEPKPASCSATTSYGVQPTDPNGPDITITGYGSFGREIFLPSTTFERHYQLQQ